MMERDGGWAPIAHIQIFESRQCIGCVIAFSPGAGSEGSGGVPPQLRPRFHLHPLTFLVLRGVISIDRFAETHERAAGGGTDRPCAAVASWLP